ncbi:class I SAM-dependent methyltransferase [archaeon]|jgi:ubiquinone/menaquinone biosynthesis C-methylase UbiE|nr:class I SAM-dependent methyltransferase [archaeon]MBT3985535.1 class I SAM-dependent methyltransferase [archaeon]MBT4460854.1 class I SAM-dependent methyltransferase [archaeon]MBT4859059.1 class I SAM-dependent methyltransferase [archaeon]MBT5424198.1 class I SAM-dependent methyltransferase [archaeon]
MDKSREAVKIYDLIAKDYADSFTKNKVESEIIDKFLDELPINPRVLDVGCGNSDYFEHFSKRNVDYTGIDLSSEMLKIARKNFPNGNFINMDMRSILFNTNFFAGIFCFYSLIHIPKKEVISVLESFSRILKPNGKILFALQEGNNEVFVPEPFLPEKQLFINLISEEEIRKLLEKIGMKIIYSKRIKPTSKYQLNYNKLFVIASK